MSYSFYVQASQAPPVADLLRRIDPADLMVVNEDLLAKWPNATIALCRRLRSTRAVYLSFAEGQIEIRTHVLSAKEDYQLALQLAVAAAEETCSLPRGEFTPAMAVVQFLATHDAAWIRESHASALDGLRILVRDKGTLAMPGPFRNCYIGPHVLAQVGRNADAAAIEQILALMRRVPWIHTEGYDTASDLRIGQTDQHIAIWFPKKRIFLPNVQWITLGEVEPMPIFPFDRLADVLGRPPTLIDECQPLIEPTQSEDLPALVARARHFDTPPTKIAPRPTSPKSPS